MRAYNSEIFRYYANRDSLSLHGPNFTNFPATVSKVRYVPGAEVDVDILNVGFGGVVSQGVTLSEASYIDRGAERARSSH